MKIAKLIISLTISLTIILKMRKLLNEDQRVFIEKMTVADYQSALQHVVAF